MFIFERPIQILLFRIHLVSVSKVCYFPSPFLDKLLTHIHEWINSDNNCWSSISDACNEAEGMLISTCEMLETVECAVSSYFKWPRVWIDIKPSSNAIHGYQARRPSKLYFVKIILIDPFYNHVFEIFVFEK